MCYSRKSIIIAKVFLMVLEVVMISILELLRLFRNLSHSYLIVETSNILKVHLNCSCFHFCFSQLSLAFKFVQEKS